MANLFRSDRGKRGFSRAVALTLRPLRAYLHVSLQTGGGGGHLGTDHLTSFCVDAFFQLGANMDVTDDEGRTALMMAAAAGHYRICKLLKLFGKANVHIKVRILISLGFGGLDP